MREYSRISPQFWMRGSGKRLRGDADAQVLAMYLVTGPAANMIGVYYVSFVAMAHETGLGEKRTREALERIEIAEFAFYDESSELVWVPNMASYQLGDTMKSGDKRRLGVLAELKKIGSHPFVASFYDLYGEPYALGDRPTDRKKCLGSLSKKGGSSTNRTPSMGLVPKSEEAEAESESEAASEPSVPDGASVVPKKLTQCDEIYEHWLVARKRHTPRAGRIEMNDGDRRALGVLLKLGRTVDEMQRCCEGHFLSDHHTGKTGGNKYIAFKYAIKETNIDGFIALADRERSRREKRPLVVPDEPVTPEQQALNVQGASALIASLNATTAPEFPIEAGSDVRLQPKAAS